MDTTSKAKFSLGISVATKRALEAVWGDGPLILEFLERHARGDWGEVSNDDAQENEMSLETGGRLLSAYRTRRGKKLWIITEADRSATTILLPEEY